jgi:NAD(P)-dependent dehydrogenase (short-subunit alcohol dehydrogenase family)
MEDLQGKVAVITGAASGIGRGMAEAFVDAGMKLVLADIEEPVLQATARTLRDAGADVHAVPIDVSKPEQIERLAMETLRKYGVVHVVCNNAGISLRTSSSWESTLDDWSWIVGVNLMSVVYGHRTFLPIMIEQGTEGHIVNTASFVGLVPGGNTPYAVTKAGVVALSEGAYLELQFRQSKIGVSVLCPAFVDTNIIQSQRNRPKELSDTAPVVRTPETEVFAEWFQSQIKHGLKPREVGDQVLAAIRARQFYILTHPNFTPVLEQRMKRIVASENPALIPPPGFESLVQMLQARLAHQG